jgi:hypothetical protein
MIQLKSDFSLCRTGLLTENTLRRIFGTENACFLTGRSERWKLRILPVTKNSGIVLFDNEHVIKLNLRRSKAGPFTGCNWKIPFPEKVESAALSYKVFFQDGFDFVKGGKLPGLAGGTGNTGGLVPNGYDGWSVRFMFKEHGSLCAYLYSAKMEGQFGDKEFLKRDESLIYLKTGTWNSITLTLTMNTPDKEDGIITSKVNGTDALALNSVCFRKTSGLKIDYMLFSCFMGGDDASYAPKQDQFLLFKDFKIEY